MELNREQIIKALECCGSKHNSDEKYECKNCPLNGRSFDEGSCYDEVLHDNALSLINQLESDNAKLAEANAIQTITAVEIDKQVQRLTEEVNDLKEDKELYSVFCEDYKGQIKKLTEENERLRAERDTFEIYYKDYKFRNGELQKDNRRWSEEYDELNRVNESLIETIAKLKGGTE